MSVPGKLGREGMGHQRGAYLRTAPSAPLPSGPERTPPRGPEWNGPSLDAGFTRRRSPVAGKPMCGECTVSTTLGPAGLCLGHEVAV